MSTSFELAASIREDLGKGATRRLRRDNKVPAVVYGGQADPVSLTLAHNELMHSTESEAFFSHILTIDIAGKAEKVVIKALQRHPSRPIIMHADFMRVNMKEKLKVNVPIHFVGEDVAPGVKEGGVVTHELVDIEIQCLPKDLPEFIEVDISELEMDASLHLTDVTVPEGVEIMALTHGSEHDAQIASIHKPRVIEEVELEAADAEGEEGEAGEEAATDAESGDKEESGE
ncbi:MAG: 50S ribosomal protein L25/general stress protein Ctc [Cycloclasticus sp. symbiont of Poecilosclerida sp. M]|nr:MAG: 50S ribosomal protein L25/general stress protein Ctc [Cycloclasticus sp. symbiont of Poecilosclerida sp. M]